MLKTGIWSGLPTLQHPELQNLASQLPQIAMQSRRDSTVNNYVSAYLRWKKWTVTFPEINHFPADPTHVSLYLVHLSNNAKTHSPISNAFYALSWIHKLAGLPDPTLHDLPKMVREAAMRNLGHGENKKQPLSVNDMLALVIKFGDRDCNLIDLRMLCMSLLSFAGFFRFDEVVSIRRSDIVFCGTYIKIFLEHSKTDKYRDGAWVFIANTGTLTCPVNMLIRYLDAAGISDDSDKFIFRQVTYFKSLKKHKLKSSDRHISYTSVREILLKSVAQLGLEVSKIGTHSLRAGGATAAANNSVEDRLFKKHGRWVSEKAKDGYVVESIDKILSVSLNLGL